ncbi:hypothetical protein BDR04DRAFT_1020337, partial [Suillus decipiens]
SIKWTRNQLFLCSRMLQKTRGVNSWNAFVKAQLKAENEGLGRGDHTKLMAFIAENKATLLQDYHKLTFAEKQAYNPCVLKDCQAKNCTAHANPKAIKHDVNAAFTFMDREWMALHACTGLEGFYVAVRGGIEDFAELKPLNTLISECHALIQDNLEFILMEKNTSGEVKMNYTNYEHAIVECHGVELTKSISHVLPLSLVPF